MTYNVIYTYPILGTIDASPECEPTHPLVVTGLGDTAHLHKTRKAKKTPKKG